MSVASATMCSEGGAVDLRVTVIDPSGTGVPVDLEIKAEPGTPLSAVRSELLRAVGREDGVLSTGAGRLDVAAPLGVPPLVAGAVLTVGGSGPVEDRRGLLELHAVGGPDAGSVYRLAPGEHSVGRAAEARIRLEDPEVSRLHAVLTVSVEGVQVRDLGSTNGTRVDGQPIGHVSASLVPGALLRVGESTLMLASPAYRRAAVRADGVGHLELNRPPRILPPVPQRQIAMPVEPVQRERARLPLVALLLPLAVAPVLVMGGSSPLFLLFLLLSPLMLLGNFAADRRYGAKVSRTARRTYQTELAGAQSRLQAALTDEEHERRMSFPDPAALLQAAAGPGPRLWERRRSDEDFLTVRVGTADLPARVTVRAPAPAEHPPAARVDFVPVTVAVREAGSVGLAGPRFRLIGLARWMIGQLAGWHSPRDLEIVVLADPDTVDTAAWATTWGWTAWLPHVAPTAGQDCTLLFGASRDQVTSRVAELLVQLDARLALRRAEPGGWVGRRTVILLDGARALRAVPGVARLLEEGPAVGLHLLCLESKAVALPAECGATVVLDGESGTRATVTARGAATVSDLVADLVSSAWAERLARAVAPLRDATPQSAEAELPDAARLLDVLPFDGTEATAVAAAWRSCPRSTRALLGVASDGAFAVDLRRDGPHALVAGTTGSGKSELLQTLIASLALSNRPDEMTFMLVDYKGGSAFRECAQLPHTVGLVTDLDGHLAERALASLDAELKRRKAILAAAGCKDIEDYVAECHQTRDPLPRLVLLIDEFATLVEELPEFVGGLVGIAQLGRSLGVHLVLATQRPAGVVSADIKANTTLRIALRVTDAGESTDVIGSRDAAVIGRGTPGRAVLRTGTGPVTAFQAARVGGRADDRSDRQQAVRRMPMERHGDPLPPRPEAGVHGPTDLRRIVDACRGAASRLGVDPVASPWLAPLPDVLAVDRIPASDSPWLVPVGVADLPRRQTQATWGLDLEHGVHLLVSGGPRSGRTTVLRTIAGQIAARHRIEDVHIYVLDAASGGLLALAALPHVGAAVSRDETSRADRLLTRLLHEVTRRQEALAREGFASVAEQRAAAAAPDRLPFLVLLVDSWEGLQSAVESVDHGRPVTTLLRLAREGPAAGLRVVLTGDRTTITSRIGSLITDRLVLRLADPADYGLAGIPVRRVPEHLPPGRGLLADGVVETQVALLAPDPAGQAQVTAVQDIAVEAHRRIASTGRETDEKPRAARGPFRVQALPARVAAGDIHDTVKAVATGPLWAFVGVGGDELDPVGVDLAQEGPAFLIAGPAGSGRSTALCTVAAGMLERGAEIVLITPRRSPLRAFAGHAGVLAALALPDGAQLREVLAEAAGPFAVLVDDVEAVHDSAVELPLVEVLRATDERPRAVVLAGSSTELAGQFRGLPVEARKNRCGLLLNPTGGPEADLLGTRVPRGDDLRPGRGVLVHRGRLVPVQVALPAGDGDTCPL
jgi:S-DNA-T family DNA segregation ATPase FtsK/SpoIIIE